MKSRLSARDPRIQAAIQDAISRQLDKEREKLMNIGISTALWTLTEPPYNWGQKRITDFEKRVLEALDRLTKDYGEFVIDKIMNDLERLR